MWLVQPASGTSTFEVFQHPGNEKKINHVLAITAASGLRRELSVQCSTDHARQERRQKTTGVDGRTRDAPLPMRKRTDTTV